MAEQSKYIKTLIKDIIDNSDSNEWHSAVEEWEISDIEEDEQLEHSCICGKQHLRYLFTIENQLNGNILYPIGSSCIRKFERDDLKDEVTIKEQLFKLLHAIDDNEYLQLSSEFFSRKLLLYLLEIGAFKATKWNDFEPENDYEFMLDMFNKRTITENQSKKVTAIILKSIKPFLQERFAHKIKKQVKTNTNSIWNSKE